jgi:hypothetical protein
MRKIPSYKGSLPKLTLTYPWTWASLASSSYSLTLGSKPSSPVRGVRVTHSVNPPSGFMDCRKRAGGPLRFAETTVCESMRFGATGTLSKASRGVPIGRSRSWSRSSACACRVGRAAGWRNPWPDAAAQCACPPGTYRCRGTRSDARAGPLRAWLCDTGRPSFLPRSLPSSEGAYVGGLDRVKGA